jgi:hypothetical protein
MSGDRPDDAPSSPPELRGCGIAVLIILGVFALLPGICSLFFMSTGLSSGLTALGLFVALAGLGLVFLAAREFAFAPRQRERPESGQAEWSSGPGVLTTEAPHRRDEARSRDLSNTLIAILLLTGLLVFVLWLVHTPR